MLASWRRSARPSGCRACRAVANDIQVRLRLDRTDEEIAGDAAHALIARATLPAAVQAAVHGGHVTLTGTVSSLFQRAIAEKAIHDIIGVKEIVNRIEVTPSASARAFNARSSVRSIAPRTSRPAGSMSESSEHRPTHRHGVVVA